MSKEYEGQDPLAIAQQAERDLNSNAMKQGTSDSSKSHYHRHLGAKLSTSQPKTQASTKPPRTGSLVPQ